ncbi:response regulator [Acidisphaera sp. L21]|jgi:DNA-binding response OmpR family regulator|uniref:response regulator n=1 Tax=Acidisphaera sp. L21 TaxID=1641851 RepID=UPI00131CE2FA|nr:response regulator [Acidisphaera sp. L21]
MELSSHSQSGARLDGVRVLVVDDEILIALDIEATLTEAGAHVVSLCITLAEALSGATLPNISAATLDIRLGRDTSEAVAMLLSERGIPFLFYSGQRLPDEIRHQWPFGSLVVKPAEPRQLVDAVAALLR